MNFPVLWLSFVSVWVGIAGPHQLNSCQNFNLLKQINNKQANKQFIQASHVLAQVDFDVVNRLCINFTCQDTTVKSDEVAPVAGMSDSSLSSSDSSDSEKDENEDGDDFDDKDVEKLNNLMAGVS